jgi:putative oxidoreductase
VSTTASQTSDTSVLARDRNSLEFGRAAFIVLWVVQVGLAVMFLFAGGSKLTGAPAMVAMFETIGVGQWFRYVTGIVECTAGILLLVPSFSIFGALLLIPTMIGAAATNAFIVHVSPAPPVVLLLVAAAIAWFRRRQLRRP